jgi:hypothetical protein
LQTSDSSVEHLFLQLGIFMAKQMLKLQLVKHNRTTKITVCTQLWEASVCWSNPLAARGCWSKAATTTWPRLLTYEQSIATCKSVLIYIYDRSLSHMMLILVSPQSTGYIILILPYQIYVNGQAWGAINSIHTITGSHTTYIHIQSYTYHIKLALWYVHTLSIYLFYSILFHSILFYYSILF